MRRPAHCIYSVLGSAIAMLFGAAYIYNLNAVFRHFAFYRVILSNKAVKCVTAQF